MASGQGIAQELSLTNLLQKLCFELHPPDVTLLLQAAFNEH